MNVGEPLCGLLNRGGHGGPPLRLINRFSWFVGGQAGMTITLKIPPLPWWERIVD
jgi:hypothetical protein